MPDPAETSRRSDGLDLLRAAAIAMVVVFHTVHGSPVESESLRASTHYGQFGVDLFFALSGWLIGSIVWREIARTGTLDLRRFWYRRWMRTLPPYFVVLLIYFLAVYIEDGRGVNIRYAFFTQNYYENIPFFTVSWSLCVEEHFYIVAPLAALWIAYARRQVGLAVAVFIGIAVFSLAGRVTAGRALDPELFGFEETATHLNLEGLALGFALALLSTLDDTFIDRNIAAIRRIAFASAAAFLILQFASPYVRYVLDPSVLAVLFGALVLCCRDLRIASPLARWSVRAIAVTSYSAYLVHPIALHLATILNNKLADGAAPSFFALAIGLTLSATTVFYVCVERVAFVLRDVRWKGSAPTLG